MKKIAIIAFASFSLFSCSKDVNEAKITASEKQQPTEVHMCTEMDLPRDNRGISAALYTSSRWTTGQVIKVKFLNGTTTQIQKTKNWADQWQNYANIKFQYVNPSENADIKVAFKWNGDEGSWSYKGKDCNVIAQNAPSMNFGWLYDNTADNEYSRVVLHEFGHALGLIHEHQSPTSNIPWNKSAVYAYYAKKENGGWTTAQVDNNIFYKYSSSQTNYSNFDPSSIMEYAVDASLTTNGYSIGWNRVLSPTDKSFIGQMYPFPIIPTQGLYRYCLPGGHHFYTSNFSELGSAYFEGTMGRLYTAQVANTAPVYRYYNKTTGDRLSTTNYNELKAGNGSWVYEGVSGYAYTSQMPNTIPVYRYYKSSTPDHFFTTSASEVAGGKYNYVYEGIAFYILQ